MGVAFSNKLAENFRHEKVGGFKTVLKMGSLDLNFYSVAVFMDYTLQL